MAFDEVIYTISSIIRQSKDEELKENLMALNWEVKKNGIPTSSEDKTETSSFSRLIQDLERLSEQAKDYSDRVHLNELKEELLTDASKCLNTQRLPPLTAAKLKPSVEGKPIGKCSLLSNLLCPRYLTGGHKNSKNYPLNRLDTR
ncbi:hypothetical protein ACE4XC_02070 [Enterococcus faecalis]|uniref:hypothetical protein n=1 Tax=Enterococcus faecalis TaxID=1351 RepID=UPI0035CB0AE4